jgi:uncharacterized protein YdhG (YjbR/CyaY superfamily)
MKTKRFKSVDEYIDSFPPEKRRVLEKVREVVVKAAPGAEERIGYGMPAYKLRHNLVYFGMHAGHLGLYPTPSATGAFAEELKPYESGKGSVKFPLDNPIPYDLIRRIVEFRVKEDVEK